MTGHIYVEILPDLKRFASTAKSQITAQMSGIANALKKPVGDAEKVVKDGGDRIGGSWRNASNQVKSAATGMADKVSSESKRGMGTATNEVKKFASEAPRSVQTGTAQMGTAFEGLRARTVAIGAAIGAVAVGIGASLVGAAKSAILGGLQMAASLEQAQIGFTTLLGSGKKAQDFLSNLQTFAAQTPFELPGLISASRQLIGVGLNTKQTMSTLTAYGDAAGALGLSQDEFNRIMLATSQALSAGTLHAGDLLQMTEAGLPIWKLLSEALGKPVSVLKDLSSQGQLMTADVLPKLNAQMEKDYGGAMAKQSLTLAGLWSTLMDTFHIGMANVLTPLEPWLRTKIPQAANFLQTALKNASQAIKEFIDGLNGVVTKGDRPASKFVEWGLKIRSLWRAFKEGDQNAAGLEGVLGKVKVAGDKLFGALENLVKTALPVLIQLWGDLKTPMHDFFDWMIATGIPAITNFFEWLANHKDMMGPVLAGVGTFIATWKTISTVKNIITGIKDSFIVLNQTMKANPILLIAAAVAAIGLAFYEAYKHSADFRAFVKDALSDIKIWALETAKWVISYLYIPILTVFSGIVHAAAAAFGWVPGIGDKLRTARDTMDQWRTDADKLLGHIQVGIDDAQVQLKLNDIQRNVDNLRQNKIPGIGVNTKLGQSLLVQLDTAMNNIKQGKPPGVTVLTEDGLKQIGTFQSFIDQIKQKKLPGINANTAEGKQVIADLQTAINNVRQGKPPGISADSGAGHLVVKALQKEIDDIKQGKEPGVSADTEAGQKKLKELQDTINALHQPVPPLITTNPAQGQARIAALQRQIDEIHQGFVPGINANTAQGKIAIADLQNQIDTIKGNTVRIQVDWSSFYTNPANVQMYTVLGHNAAGGPIRGPGGPREDKVLMLGSSGEYMINAAAVSKYGRGFMDNLNAMKFAAGGPVISLSLPNGAQMNSVMGASIRGIMNRLHIKDPLGLGLNLAQYAPSYGGAVPGGGSVSPSVQAEQDYALSQFRYYNWPASELSSLISLWNGESGWNPFALNASSGAYGIPQSLPAEKMASAGADWRTNPATQIRWGENYISQVYGTPSAAWSAWLSRSPHWYGNGLNSAIFKRPTLIGVGERGAEEVSVRPAGRRKAAPPMVVRLDDYSIAAIASRVVEMDGQAVAKIVSKYQALAERKGVRR